ncbi:MAG: S8 family serine peptidase [Cyanobium sp.]
MASPSEQAEGLFGPEADNRVTGELLLKLQPGAVATFSESIPSGPLGSRGFNLPTALGLPTVDAVLSAHPIRSITRLHDPLPMEAMALAEDRALGATFRVRLRDEGNLDQACRDLAQAADVEVVEPNRWREASVLPNDPGFSSQWGLARIHCPEAWALTRGSRRVVVAVVDTGVDLDHPELAPLLLPGQDLVDLAGTSPPAGTRFEGDWLQRDDRPQDEVGHGTHVAGTIACASNTGFGVAGINWLCSLLPVKVLTRVVSTQAPERVRAIGSSADIAAGIRWAVDHGAQIINLSLGSYSSTFVERDAVAYAVSRGVVVVAAMGNDGSGTPAYPAAYPGVIAVGATDPTDQRARFSNFGSHLSLVAPGSDILSTDWKSTHGSKSGTSMACPHVSGVAALILAWNPQLKAEDILTILRETADPLRANTSDSIPNDYYGYGLVNAVAALQRASPNEAPKPNPYSPYVPGNAPYPPPRPPFTFPPSPPTPTMPTAPAFRPTLTLTRPTLTRPTFFTRPTLTRPTFTRPTPTTLPAIPPRPTLTTFPPRPTLTTLPPRPTLTTFPPRPTLTTFPRPTLTTFPRPTIRTFPIDTPGFPSPAIGGVASSYESYADPYADPYGAYSDPYGYAASGYEAYDPYAGYGYEAQAYDPYGAYAAASADPYGYGYGAYGNEYGTGYDPYGTDPYAGATAYEGYTGYEGYYDPYQGY